MHIDAVLTPAEFSALAIRDLRTTTCVVFDVLRATSSMLTALSHGAKAILPVSEIEEAVAARTRIPETLLAGERGGVRIGPALTGGVEFDFGNSPREFTAARVAGRTLAWTTTNGTRALRACAHAERVMIGALVNVAALAAAIPALRTERLLFVCAGTHDGAAFEDHFAAGALVDALLRQPTRPELGDAAGLVWHAYRAVQDDAELVASSLNARRLLAMPDLAPDVPICLARDTVPLLATLGEDGTLRR
jgi:2-phosphosulfolactate phosphatase